MSQTEHHRGKLIPVVPQEGETLQEVAKRILIYNDIEPGDTEDFVEQVHDDLYREYFVAENKIYKVQGKVFEDGGDVFNAHKNPDGTISYEVVFYNGGCSFNDALEQALEDNNINLNDEYTEINKTEDNSEQPKLMEWKKFSYGLPTTEIGKQVKIFFGHPKWATFFVGMYEHRTDRSLKENLSKYDVNVDCYLEWLSMEPTHYMICPDNPED